MSAAVLCDVCGSLVLPGNALSLEITIPKDEKGEERQGWSGIDVCWSCVKDATVYAVVHAGCNNSEELLNALAG